MIVDEVLVEKIRKANPDIAIESAIYSDAGSFTGLMNSNYKRKFTIQYFYWRYMQNVDKTKLFVAKKNNEIVGFSGIHIRTLSNNQPCGFTADVLIDEKYRGRGILVLLEYAMEKFARSNNAKIMLVFANPLGRQAFVKAGDWRYIGEINTLEYRPSSTVIPFENLPKIERSKHPIILRTNSDYRDWRFNKCPWYEYRRVEIDSHIFAYIKVFIDPTSGKKYGDIVDYRCSNVDQKSLKKLFRKTIASFPQDINNITTWALPHTLFFRVLRHIGFSDSSKKTFFCIKVLDKKYDYLYAFKNWHLVQADSEVY